MSTQRRGDCGWARNPIDDQSIFDSHVDAWRLWKDSVKSRIENAVAVPAIALFALARNQQSAGASDTLTDGALLADICQFSAVSGQFSVAGCRLPMTTDQGKQCIQQRSGIVFTDH